MNVDINKLEEIKAQLSQMKEDDALFIEQNGEVRYAIVPIEKYDKAEGFMAILDAKNENEKPIRIIGANNDLSYEEYEQIKTIILDTFEKTFKPKAEKLN